MSNIFGTTTKDWFACDSGSDNLDVDENLVDVNLEQATKKTLQNKWVEFESPPKKELNTNAVCSLNYDLNDKTSNGFQSAKNRNGTASMGSQINGAFAASDWDEDVVDDWYNVDGGDGGGAIGGDVDRGSDGYASGAASIVMNQHPTVQFDEKSISIKNRSNASAAPVSSVRYTKYKRQTNIINDSSRAYSNDHRRHHQSNTLFEIIRPMKTQCKTTGECLYFCQVKCSTR